MKTPKQVFEILKREFEAIKLKPTLSSNDTTGVDTFKQNNFDVFYAYEYTVKGIDYDNGDYLTPSDFDIKFSNLNVHHLEVTFKGDDIEFTEYQNETLKELLTIKINE